MSKFKTYSEKLRDPRWQKKRLEVMERDEWHCTFCHEADKTLNVHHGYYERGLDPWEYDSDTLWTLCEDCHKDVGKNMSSLYKILAKIWPEGVSSLGDMDATEECLRFRLEFMAPVILGKILEEKRSCK